MRKFLHTLKLVFLAAGALCGCTQAVDAYTIAQLGAPNGFFEDAAVAFEVVYTQKNATSANTQTPFMSVAYTSSGQVVASDVVSTGQNFLLLDGLFGGTFYGFFTVNGSTVNLNAPDGYYAASSNTEKPVTGEATENGAAYPYFCLEGAYHAGRGNYGIQSSWSGTVSENERYFLITMEPVRLSLYTTRNNLNYDRAAARMFYDQLVIYIPKDGTLNSVFTDNYLGVDRTYPARTVVDFENNRFQIWNMTSNGFAVSHEIRSASMSSYPYYSYQYYFANLGPVEGTLYPDQTGMAGTVALDSHQAVNSYPEFKLLSNGTYSTQMYDYFLCQAGSTNTSSIIYGTYEIKDLQHQADNRWHKNSGGSLKTTRDMVISLDDMQKRNDTKNNNVGPYRNTTLTCADEYTANPTFADNVIAYDHGLLRLAARIDEDKCDNVESYELVVLPYVAETIAGDNGFSHTGHGHAKAVNMTLDGVESTHFFPQLNSARVDLAPSKTLLGSQMTYDELQGAGWDDNDMANMKAGKVSFYIKANYNNGLEPTYHALSTARKISTGIDINEAVAEMALTVNAAPGAITVGNCPGVVKIYSASGAEVYAGEAGTIAVAPGMYVVEAGGKVVKIVVR